MRVLFWGTPAYAVPSLDALLRSRHTLVGLVTQPDRPRGRSSRPGPPATKRYLLDSGAAVPVLQPEKASGPDLLRELAALDPDVSVVAAYGKLLPQAVLDLPRLGSLNLHASLLPRHRGASPVAAAILAGDAVTGVTLMRMERGLDTGPILLQRDLAIAPEESCGRLTERLAWVAAEVVLEGLDAAEEGRLRATPQRESEATYAPRIHPDQARVDWNLPADVLERTLRAYDPWPGAFTYLAGKRLKLFRGRVRRRSASPDAGEGEEAASAPGEVLAGRPGRGLLVATGAGALEVLEVQLEGRGRMPAVEFLRGTRLAPGARLA